MLKIEPLNVLELVSCNPGLQKYRMYTELPYCEICNEYFTNRKALRKHEHTIKVNQYTNVLSKEYLKKGMSVTETCFSVGFESLGSFSKLFKTKVGKSPSEFQKEQLSRSNNFFND